VSLASKSAITGLPQVFTWLGNVPSFEFELAVDKLEHIESYSGQNLMDVSLVVSKKGTFKARGENFDIDALAFGMYGTKVTVAGSTVTNELTSSGLVVGDEIFSVQQKISSLVITDSTGSPITLVNNTDYQIMDATTGRIKILNITALVQPYKLAYTYAASKAVGMFVATPSNKWLRYEGINLANNNSKVIVDLFNVQIDPMASLPMISDGNTIAGYDLSGSVLLEPLISSGSSLGQYGSIRDLA
jgi:hypothetical protein